MRAREGPRVHTEQERESIGTEVRKDFAYDPVMQEVNFVRPLHAAMLAGSSREKRIDFFHGLAPKRRKR